jgi:toxin YoeB
MRLTWLPNGWKDYLHWQEHDRKILQRVNDVIRGALRNPFNGIGKPETLRNNLKGWWSRRITGEQIPRERCVAGFPVVSRCSTTGYRPAPLPGCDFVGRGWVGRGFRWCRSWTRSTTGYEPAPLAG